MTNEFTGRLVHIGQTEQFETREGKKFTSREITLATDEQFPKTACFTLRNELAQNFSHNIGETISVRFDFHARPNREGTRYYNELKKFTSAKTHHDGSPRVLPQRVRQRNCRDHLLPSTHNQTRRHECAPAASGQNTTRQHAPHARSRR